MILTKMKETAEDVLCIINEPTAAAIACGLDRKVSGERDVQHLQCRIISPACQRVAGLDLLL